jgi:hypothetical protein
VSAVSFTIGSAVVRTSIVSRRVRGIAGPTPEALAGASVSARLIRKCDDNQRKAQAMATVQGTPTSMEAAIISRIVQPEKDDIPDRDIAKAMLRMRLDQSDLDKLHVLVVKNQADALTPSEKTELEIYLRISLMVDLMHAKALRALKKHR